MEQQSNAVFAYRLAVMPLQQGVGGGRYQLAVPGTGKLVFCTRTVPEMSKALEELRLVLESEILGAVLVITSLDWYVWNGFADFEYVY